MKEQSWPPGLRFCYRVLIAVGLVTLALGALTGAIHWRDVPYIVIALAAFAGLRGLEQEWPHALVYSLVPVLIGFNIGFDFVLPSLLGGGDLVENHRTWSVIWSVIETSFLAVLFF